jgi:hypothetical protein
MDVEEGINTLERSSLIEIFSSPEDDQEFISLPLAARLFGRKKLLVSPVKSSIDSDTELVRFVGAMDPSEILRGVGPRVRTLFRNVADAVQSGSRTIDNFLPVLEYVARSYPPAWLHLADFYLEETTGGAIDHAEAAIRRYLETVPMDWAAWRRLAALCSQSGDHLGEINALIQRASQPGVPYEDISYASNRFNWLISEAKLRIELPERRLLAKQLLDRMTDRVSEADATDCSRIAWLYRVLGQDHEVRRYTELGLSMDPTNTYCLKLMAGFANR